MDINPKKFEKPKDHLFFDFFSAYAKNFIDGKKNQPRATSCNYGGIALQKITNEDEQEESKSE